jgi:hypothetical protein
MLERVDRHVEGERVRPLDRPPQDSVDQLGASSADLDQPEVEQPYDHWIDHPPADLKRERRVFAEVIPRANDRAGPNQLAATTFSDLNPADQRSLDDQKTQEVSTSDDPRIVNPGAQACDVDHGVPSR